MDDLASLAPKIFTKAEEIEAAKNAADFLDAYLGGALYNFGGIIGDTVSVWRFKNQVRLAQDAESYCKERGIDPVAAKLSVAVPLIEEAGKVDDEDLSDLFAHLLATSMDPEMQEIAHPAFIRIIRDLSPDEARLFRSFWMMRDMACLDIEVTSKPGHGTNATGVENWTEAAAMADNVNKAGVPGYVDNLLRLRLLEKVNLRFQDDRRYEQIKDYFEYSDWIDSFGSLKDIIEFREREKILRVTDFGRQFLRACVQTRLNW